MLLDAAERLLARVGRRFSLTDLAAEANVSTATAYRHFGDVAEVLDAYYEVLISGLVSHMAALPETDDPLARFRAVCALWVRDATVWGRAAVQVRSSAGFLARLHSGDFLVTTLHQALAPLVTDMVDARVIPPVMVEYATMIWATIFDERVIVDLLDLGWSVDRVAARLTGTALGALGQAAPDDRGDQLAASR